MLNNNLRLLAIDAVGIADKYLSGELLAEELYEASTTRKIRAVQKEGNRNVERDLQFYNLDAIISVG